MSRTMGLQRLAQGVIGVSLAIAILFFAGVSAARYLINRLTELPPRPVFPNDTAPPGGAVPAADGTVPPPDTTPVQAAASGEVYTARVLPAVGIVLRDGPSLDSAQIGGIDYNQEITVLETSADGGWLRVRLNDGSEGWVKAGNTERIQ
ncbi:SH3 domain-containing protein [Thermoleptolyngbya oregonensis NK1-22]|uniref:SH3 domain-containing protein n=2 Tax=Thermoleptolyngbya TaxID=2303528 RepID=A0AA97BKE7_9CYAN|nr:SH3 domain-containing protein [Thermoleptolyngbya oregonensis]MBF2084960.1 SH3 domain-containing protein [Thermoleptolyngbya sp. C42_A2020_037]WOB41862.1 SH3 domain-containing protein [Thermoleptolyngbya oregonensis NK1-22]